MVLFIKALIFEDYTIHVMGHGMRKTDFVACKQGAEQPAHSQSEQCLLVVHFVSHIISILQPFIS